MAVSTYQLTGGTASGDSASGAGADHRGILAISPVPMLICDAQSRIVAANAPAARLFRVAIAADLSGREIGAFLTPESMRHLQRIARTLADKSTSPASVQLSCLRTTGEPFDAEIFAQLGEWNGDRVTVYAITDRTLSTRPPVGVPVDSSSRRLTEAIESLSEGFAVFAPDGTLSAFNENYRTKIWPSLTDFIKPGVRFEEIVRETARRNVWQSTGIDVEEFVHSALTRQANVPSVHEIEYPDGRCIQQTKRRTSDGGVVAIYADITDLRRREADIAEAQERHRRLLETLPDGVIIHSGGKFAYANPAAISILGARSHTDLVGRASGDFIQPEDREEGLARLEKVLSDRISMPPVEQSRIRLDGRIIRVEVRHTYILWNAKPAVLTVLRDLTEQKRVEHAMRETERRYLSIASNLPGAVYQRVMHADGTIHFPYVSRGVIETHGIDAESVMKPGSLLVRAIHPDDRERYAKALEESARDLKPFDEELRNIRPDGRVVCLRSLARPHRRDDGATVWDGIFVDITARRLAEDRAAQTYRWLTDAINSLPDGFVLWDADDRLVLWNDRFIERHPQRDEIVHVGTPFTAMIERTAENLRKKIGDRATAGWLVERIRHHEAAEGAYEMMTAIGRWLTVTERKTQEGYTVGIYSDVTDRKRSEDELRGSEERHRRLIQLSPDAILVHRDSTIVFANDTAVSMFGAKSIDEMIGRNVLDFALPENHLRIIARRNKVVESEPSSFMQSQYRTVDGDARHCESAIARFAWKGEDAFLTIIRDIGDRVEAERQQAIFSAVLDQAADSIEITSADLKITYVNPAFEQMTGYSFDEVIGKSPGALFRPPGHDPELYDAIEQTLWTGRPWAGILPACRKDGSVFQQEVSVSPVFDESGSIENFVAIKRDITERIETETELRESEERYRKLLSLTPDAIYVHVESIVVLVNEAAVEMFGAEDEKDLIGRSVYELVHKDFHSNVKNNLTAMFSDGIETLRFEHRRTRLDGSEFWANTSATPLTWQGGKGSLVIVRDITQERNANQRLVKAMEVAEVANKSKSEFLANMSHELRTPLNAIIGFSEIMQSEMFGPIGADRYREYSFNIHESGMLLLHVINDILDLSKVEAGKMQPNLAEIVVADVVAASMRMFNRSAVTAGVTIESRMPADLPRVWADERMVKQMLMNLVSNAVKFTPSGGRIRVKARQQGPDFIEISVIDNGIGISGEDLTHVMEPFYQSGQVTADRVQGTGLGLPLVSSFAELHGGDFRLGSRPGLGTRAVITLPVSPPAGTGAADV